MLAELYNYAIDNNLSVQSGFKEKNVKYYISIGINGEVLDFVKADKKPLCPDLGSLANGTTKSNIIAEKTDIVFNLPEKDGTYKREQKHIFYMNVLKEIGEIDELFKTAYDSIDKNMENIKAILETKKIKNGDIISIMVDGKPLESTTKYLPWWESFRNSFKTGISDEKRCFITGNITSPMKTIPPISGLYSVGGHSKGDTLISFDKDAFQSYGFDQSENAAVSEEAMFKVNLALTKLLKDSSSTLAGAKNIHWFSEAVSFDVFDLIDNDIWDIGLINEAEAASEEEKEKAEDNRRVAKLFDSLKNGTYPEQPQNKYYMMSLSGVGGRIMVRSYEEGYYRDLYENIKSWYNDLDLGNTSTGIRFPKLYAIYYRMLKYTGSEKKSYERMAKELSGVSPYIIHSVIHNTPMPDTVALKAISYIKSKLYDKEKKSVNIDKVSCQVLKAWLNRKYRSLKKEEYIIMNELNTSAKSKAYNFGRLMAVYVALQNKALGGVNAGVGEKYYNSASTTPSFVLGKLAALSQYHLAKLEPGMKIYYSKLLSEIGSRIGEGLPRTFTLEEQSEFALGYYFQTEKIYEKKDTKENSEEQ